MELAVAILENLSEEEKNHIRKYYSIDTYGDESLELQEYQKIVLEGLGSFDEYKLFLKDCEEIANSKQKMEDFMTVFRKVKLAIDVSSTLQSYTLKNNGIILLTLNIDDEKLVSNIKTHIFIYGICLYLIVQQSRRTEQACGHSRLSSDYYLLKCAENSSIVIN